MAINGARALCIAIDVSGSMINGRLDLVKDAVGQLIDELTTRVAYNGLLIDVSIVLFNQGTSVLTHEECTLANLDEIRAFVDAAVADGNTNFEAASEDIRDFFNAGAAKTLVRRACLFISDGEPSQGSLATGVANLSDILDQDTGTFSTASGTAVQMHSINIDLADTTSSEQFDNTPCDGVPVVTVSSEGALIFENILDGITFSETSEDTGVEDQSVGWLLPIEWGSSVTEEVAFRTEIITSRNGTEQRIAQRENPRLSMGYNNFLNRTGMRQAALRLAERQAREMYAPSPRRAVKVFDGAQFGTSSMMVSHNPGWIRPGARMILEDGDTREIVIVADLCGTEIQIGGTFKNSYGLGALVQRGVKGHLSGDTRIRARTSEAGTVALEFNADPVGTWHERVDDGLVFHKEKEVFDHRVNWRRASDVNFTQPFEDLDLNRGPTDRLFPVDFTTRATRVLATVKDEATFQETYGFFYRHKGKWKTFYAPTYLNEIIPLGGVFQDGNTMTLRGREYFDVYENSEQYGELLIKAEGLDDAFYEITDISLDVVDNTVLTFAETFPADIEVDEFKTISWFVLCRFATDTMTVNWLTDTVGEIGFGIQTVKV